MKTSLIYFVVLAFLVTGCSTTDRFPRAAAKARAFDINVHSIRGPVTIRLNTRAEPYKAEFFTLQADSAYWSDYSTGSIMSAPLQAINEVSVQDRLTGMLHGAIGGIVPGAAVGAAFQKDNNAAVPLAILGGYAAGGLLGYLFGFQRHFVFE